MNDWTQKNFCDSLFPESLSLRLFMSEKPLGNDVRNALYKWFSLLGFCRPQFRICVVINHKIRLNYKACRFFRDAFSGGQWT